MKYILDTNAVSFLMKGDANVIAHLKRVERGEVGMPQPVVSEIGTIKAALERKGERIDDFDAAVAAHAITRGCVLVTANLKHMTRVPDLDVEDWSEKLQA